MLAAVYHAYLTPSAVSIRENYRLHVPIRMTLAELVSPRQPGMARPTPRSPHHSLQLFRKVLRARDSKGSEAQHARGVAEAGKGRSQVGTGTGLVGEGRSVADSSGARS